MRRDGSCGLVVGHPVQIMMPPFSASLNDENFPHLWTKVDDAMVPPMILSPHHTWLQNPYSHGFLTEEENYYNYRLRRGRIVIECAYGEYKGRWRITHRKQEFSLTVLARIGLACIVLQNICIDMVEAISIDDDLDAMAVQEEWYPFRLIGSKSIWQLREKCRRL